MSDQYLKEMRNIFIFSLNSYESKSQSLKPFFSSSGILFVCLFVLVFFLV